MAQGNDKEEKSQAIYLELQNLQEAAKQLQRQLQLVEAQFLELSMAAHSIDEIKKAKPKSEMLVPLSSGVFAKAELKDADFLVVNVGADVAVKKDAESTKRLIKEQLSELDGLRKKLSLELDKIRNRATFLDNELQKLIQ